ncbi:MAG: CbrC family protein [Pseudomonadota bacterium]
MSSDLKQPHFRFLPRAYELDGVFEKTDATCPVYQKPAGWRYVGSIYSNFRGEIQPGAQSIFERKLGSALGDDDYTLHDAEFSDALNADLEAEILQRTPGFPTYNPFTWPVRDDFPLAFIGYGDEAWVKDDKKARAAIAAAGQTLGEEDWDYPTSYALIFRTLDGETYAAEIDLD